MAELIFAMCAMVMMTVIGGVIILCSSNEYMGNIDREEERK